MVIIAIDLETELLSYICKSNETSKILVSCIKIEHQHIALGMLRFNFIP